VRDANLRQQVLVAFAPYCSDKSNASVAFGGLGLSPYSIQYVVMAYQEPAQSAATA